MSLPLNKETEWLETDGLGGFASGSTRGIRTRRYHGLLISATTPPTGRVALVSGLEAWLEMEMGSFPLTSQMYFPGVVSPNGTADIDSFRLDPWPQWTYHLPYGMTLERELFMPKGRPAVALSWKLTDPKGPIKLKVRPLLSVRDYHSLQHENKAFRFDVRVNGDGRIEWTPSPGFPSVSALFNGRYLHQPDWYRQFLYEREEERGLDFLEDLATPGVFEWDLSRGRALLVFTSHAPGQAPAWAEEPAEKLYGSLREEEGKRRAAFPDALARSADAYFVKRDRGVSLIAGYPWFTDWGRDTFVSLRGMGMALGRLSESRQILLEWAKSISQGMVPNRFPDSGQAPEYHSVDASLWYVISVYDYLRAARQEEGVSPKDWKEFQEPLEKILEGYFNGTRWGIRADQDGLLWAGEGDDSLTWMDARVNNRAVTSRVGKPVEVQALWLNALWVGGHLSDRWEGAFRKASQSFQERFWNEAGGFLYDVVDVKRRPGDVDASFRPNQVLAAGGLPLMLLDADKARRMLDAVEQKLLTPQGLRTLAPGEPGYRRHYQGGVMERDSSYHQGTVWPWLLGPFVEAWVRVRSETAEAKKEARERFLAPLLGQLDAFGLGHLSELTDAEAPFTPRGCPFQAWSLAEAIRLDRVVLK